MQTRTYTYPELLALINRCPNNPGAVRTLSYLYTFMDRRTWPVSVRLNPYESAEVDSWQE